MNAIDFKGLALNNRKSIKRAIARFCFLKNLNLAPDEFNTLVRRTQDSGYNSAIHYLSVMLEKKGVLPKERRQLLLQFTIEYNTEMYCKQFPSGNKSLERILVEQRTPDDEKFFRDYLYDVVKANKIQLEVINKYL